MTTASSRVAILMGSDSDLGVMRGAADVLAEFGIAYELRVLSAHRSPARAAAYVEAARGRGIQVIIAGAGLAAHLAGVCAAHTGLPVIGVPLKSESGGLGGADALYATVQMPPGIPVATVAIGGAKNAGHLAARILALGDPELTARVEAFRQAMDAELEAKNARIAALGVDGYLTARAEG